MGLLSNSPAAHMSNNVRQFCGCLAMSITEDGVKYPRKEINLEITSGERISSHFQPFTVIRINTFEPAKSEPGGQ